MTSSPEIPMADTCWDWLRSTMRSVHTLLRIKLKRDEEEAAQTWISGTKGDGTAPQVHGARYFSFQELKQCTDNFSENNKIGEGGWGEVYKGYCTNGVIVAIKRARKESMQGRKDFQSEIEVLSRVHHKNIVSLVGFCYEQGEQLLVYEYMSNGSLSHIIHGKGVVYLDWEKRLQIALDSARALAYLHELANPLIIHRDVKLSNILLDENFNAKVADFGLSKLVSEKQKGHASSQGRGVLAHVEMDSVAGTIGYMAPEYMMEGLLSEKSDVYAFGVDMLELLTGRRAYEFVTDEVTSMPLGDKVRTAIDENDQQYYGFRGIIDPKIVNQVRIDGLRKFVQLALKCLEDSASDRPSMSESMKEIDIIIFQLDRSEWTTTVDELDDLPEAS